MHRMLRCIEFIGCSGPYLKATALFLMLLLSRFLHPCVSSLRCSRRRLPFLLLCLLLLLHPLSGFRLPFHPTDAFTLQVLPFLCLCS